MDDGTELVRIDPRLTEILGVGRDEIARMGLCKLARLVHDKGLSISASMRDPGAGETPGLDMVLAQGGTQEGA